MWRVFLKSVPHGSQLVKFDDDIVKLIVKIDDSLFGDYDRIRWLLKFVGCDWFMKTDEEQMKYRFSVLMILLDVCSRTDEECDNFLVNNVVWSEKCVK